MVYILLGNGFEESEALVPVDLLRRAGAKVTLVGLDGLEITASAIYTGAFYEICDYLSLTAHFASPITLNMSDATWQSLTEEQQGWVMEAAQLARDESRETVRGNVDTMLEEMEAAGCQINEIEDVAEFQEATAPVIDWIRSELGDELLDMVLAKLGR